MTKQQLEKVIDYLEEAYTLTFEPDKPDIRVMIDCSNAHINLENTLVGFRDIYNNLYGEENK